MSMEKLAASKKVKSLDQLNKKFLSSPDGKQLVKEVKEVKDTIKKSSIGQEKLGSIHLSDKEFDDIADEVEDVAEVFKKLEKSHWANVYDRALTSVGKSEQAHRVRKDWLEV